MMTLWIAAMQHDGLTLHVKNSGEAFKLKYKLLRNRTRVGDTVLHGRLSEFSVFAQEGLNEWLLHIRPRSQ